MSDRDLELGEALRALPTPDHGPGFWQEMEERLGAQAPLVDLSRQRARRMTRRTMWLLSAAAAVAVLMATVTVLLRDGETSLRLTPPATTPQTWSWSKLPQSPLAARKGHVAIWTGTKMLVWGGHGAGDRSFSDGAAYDPSTDRWEAMAEAPTGPLLGATAVWTGQKMLIWGTRVGEPGDPESELAAGAAYDPATDRWNLIRQSPLGGIAGHVAVWSGEAMLVWGGSLGERPVAEGAAYDPVRDRWTRMAPAPIAPRFDHTGVWTGDRMIVWGGFAGEESSSQVAHADGAAYDPATDSWTELSPAPIAGRAMHSALWSGTTMVVWGGSTSTQGLVADGARYDPMTGSWEVLDPSPLAPRLFPSAVATQGSVLVWGGDDGTADAAADGAEYEPASGGWRLLPESPTGGRARHSAVWTGTAMIVWGGASGQTMHADGAVLRRDGAVDATPPATTASTSASTAPSDNIPVAPAQCADVAFTPDSDDLAGSIVAQGMGCQEAEAFVRKVAAGLSPVNGPSRIEKDGFVCVRTAQEDEAMPAAVFECSSGAKRVTFVRT